MDDLIILLLAFESELKLEGNTEISNNSKRKEHALILKTFSLIADRFAASAKNETFAMHSALFTHKELHGPLLSLTHYLLTTSQSDQTPKFVYRVYSAVFEFAPPGNQQAERVIWDLCRCIKASFVANLSIFVRKKTLRLARVSLHILLQLSTRFASKMTVYFDQLLGLLSEVSKELEGPLPDLFDVRRLFLVLAHVAVG